MHPMDRDNSSASPSQTNDVGVTIGDIGFSTGLGPTPNIPRLAAVMRTGQKVTELTFMGAGKGSGRGHTPDLYGKKQRQALRELQKANRYDFTTHASVGVSGFSGADQQGNFSKQQQRKAVEEIERAIHFAADVTGGGSIVMHTGEFFRHASDAKWNKEGKWKNKFKLFEDEDKKATFRVIDTRSGAVLDTVKKNTNIVRPEWLKYNEQNKDLWGETKGKSYTDEKGRVVKKGDFVDYEGNLVTDLSYRLPAFDSKTNRFKTQSMGWEEISKEAEVMTKSAREHFRNWDSMSKEEKKQSKWENRIKYARENGLKEKDIEVLPEEAYVISGLETTAATARGWAHSYGGEFDEKVQSLKKLKEAKKIYTVLQDEVDPEKQHLLKKKVRDLHLSIAGEFVDPESKLPVELIDQEMRKLKNSMMQSQEASANQWTQAETNRERIKNVQSGDTYGLQESFDAYAQAGIKAMVESDNLEKNQKKLGREFRKPIALAIENLFPDRFGGHPDELIDVIQGSRRRMAKKLQQQGMSEEKAKKKAEKHIYGTFDTAHMNMWWKHWQGDQKKTFAENKVDFDEWYLEKVEKMAKNKIIGHLHLVDSYGYDDEHLAPGEGNTPVTRALKIFKKHGYKGDIIIEPGADFDVDSGGTQTLLKAWKHFGSPIYGVGSGASRSFGSVQNAYAGQPQPPYFTIRPYAPSEDWSLWSGVPLE